MNSADFINDLNFIDPKNAKNAKNVRKANKVYILSFIIFILISIHSKAQINDQNQSANKKGWTSASNSSSLSVEAQSAKALLEDLISRRYSQDLSTFVDRQAFSVGTKLDLLLVMPKKDDSENKKESEPMNDLMLGILDPEELLKKFAPDGQQPFSQGVLSHFQIKSVNVSVGIREGLSDETKLEIEKWLKNRIDSEFGKVGQGQVTSIKIPQIIEKPKEKEKKETPKDIMEFIEKFQQLSGQIILGIAILMAVLLWKILGGSRLSGQLQGGDTQLSGQLQGSSTGEKASNETDEESHKKDSLLDPRQMVINQDILLITDRMKALMPKVAKELENIVRVWCQMGDEGKFRLACFAEVMGQEVGKLPIPIDALSDVSKVFVKMSSAGSEEKLAALQKAYWDFLSVLNLGTESLVQPFSYLGNMNLGLVNQVLMDQNPKMKTLVSIFMPEELRSKYIRNLSRESKLEILQEACQLREIGTGELRSLDGSISGKIKPASNQDVISLDRTFNRVADSLSPSESVVILSEISHSVPLEYKQTVPNIAFLAEWPDDKLSILLSSVGADELVAFLRLKSELKERFTQLSPPMTAEMVVDELSRPGNESDKETERFLEKFNARVKDLVSNGAISLEEIFKQRFIENESSNDEIKKAS